MDASVSTDIFHVLPLKIAQTTITPKLPPICRNCGNDGHLHCKRIYSENEKKHIKDVVIGKLQERLQYTENKAKRYNIEKQIRDIQAEVGSEHYDRLQKDKEERNKKSKDPENRARERKKKQEYREVPENRKKIKDYRNTDHYKETVRLNNLKIKEPHASVDIHRLQRPDALASLDEINRIIAEYDFDKYKRNDADLYRVACQAL